MKIIISHIPKTAGTSLANVVARNYPKTRRLFIYPELTPKLLNRAKSMNYLKCLMGHFGFGLHEKIDFPPNYISVMRNPLDQIISHYKHMLEKGFDNFSIPEGTNKFTYFINSQYANNIQTRYFTGLSYTEFLVRTDEENLELAKSNISKYYLFVGILENMNDTIYMLAEILNWHYIDIPKTNLSSTNFSFNEYEIELLKKKINLDVALYDFVNLRFQKKLKEQNDNKDIIKHRSERRKSGKNIIYFRGIEYYDSIRSKLLNILKIGHLGYSTKKH